MMTVSMTALKARLSACLKICAEGPVLVTKNGRPTAVLVAISDEEELERLVLAHTPRFRASLDSAERRIRRGAGIEHEAFWRTLMAKDRVASRAARSRRMARASRRVRRESMRVNREFSAIGS
jgi:prevent-host-death family protein